MSTKNEVVRRYYCERFSAPPHAYFSVRGIPITAYVVDEIALEITKKTKEVTVDRMFLKDSKILKIKVCRDGHLLDHEVLTPRKQEIDLERLKRMDLEGPMYQIVYPVEVRLDREYQAGERVQLTIETTNTYKVYPEKKDAFLPSVEFLPLGTFLDPKYWPKKPNSASICFVLPKGFEAVSMSSEGPDHISEYDGNSFVGWVFRGETHEYLRHWIVARMSLLYFLLLYAIIPFSGSLAMLASSLGISVPLSIATMLCGLYFAARYYLHEKTLYPLGGDLVMLTTFTTLLISVFVDFDPILLIINLAVAFLPWIAFYLRYRDTKRNRKKNDPYLGA